jgi:hypothetical protein
MALAALTTGGMFSVGATGNGVFCRTRPPVEGVGLERAGVVVDCKAEFAVAETWLFATELGWLVSAVGKSCLRTGSEAEINLELTAGVLTNAPGTGRMGVDCG